VLFWWNRRLFGGIIGLFGENTGLFGENVTLLKRIWAVVVDYKVLLVEGGALLVE